MKASDYTDAKFCEDVNARREEPSAAAMRAARAIRIYRRDNKTPELYADMQADAEIIDRETLLERAYWERAIEAEARARKLAEALELIQDCNDNAPVDSADHINNAQKLSYAIGKARHALAEFEAAKKGKSHG